MVASLALAAKPVAVKMPFRLVNRIKGHIPTDSLLKITFFSRCFLRACFNSKLNLFWLRPLHRCYANRLSRLLFVA